MTNKDDEQVLERNILRKIYEPVQESDCTCRIKSNNDINELNKKPDIVRIIQSKTGIAWTYLETGIPKSNKKKALVETSKKKKSNTVGEKGTRYILMKTNSQTDKEPSGIITRLGKKEELNNLLT